MTPFASILLEHLQGEKLPATTSELVFDFEVFADMPSHDYAAEIPADVPKAVREALEELKAYGRIVGDEKGWKWKPPEEKKQDRQASLFD